VEALTDEGTAVAVDAPPDPTSGGSQNSLADPLDRIRQVSELLASGAITDDEYNAAKEKLLDEL
jgi:hypothetical protein